MTTTVNESGERVIQYNFPLLLAKYKTYDEHNFRIKFHFDQTDYMFAMASFLNKNRDKLRISPNSTNIVATYMIKTLKFQPLLVNAIFVRMLKISLFRDYAEVNSKLTNIDFYSELLERAAKSNNYDLVDKFFNKIKNDETFKEFVVEFEGGKK